MKKQRNIGESSYNFRTYYVPIFGLNNEPRDREIFFLTTQKLAVTITTSEELKEIEI